LREGGSLPAIVEADDDGMYVLKFRGAGQGAKSLIAELVAGEIARASGLLVPEIVFVELDPELARTEPDPEIQDLIRASAGLNLALDYLPGSVTFDPIAQKLDAELASCVVWLDAYVTNVDRTAAQHKYADLASAALADRSRRNALLPHTWKNYRERSKDPFPAIKDHVLLPIASDLQAVDSKMTERLAPDIISSIIKLIPDAWLVESPFSENTQHRDAYLEYLLNRLEPPHIFLEEAIRARALYV
jgi:hypothetical protein